MCSARESVRGRDSKPARPACRLRGDRVSLVLENGSREGGGQGERLPSERARMPIMTATEGQAPADAKADEIARLS